MIFEDSLLGMGMFSQINSRRISLDPFLVHGLKVVIKLVVRANFMMDSQIVNGK
jgi:hypothetical protein